MTDNFGSPIRTENPFKENFLRRASMAPIAHQGPSQSRSAFARALSDQTATDMRNTFEEQGREYRQKAEDARARDVQADRERQTARYGLGREKEVTLRQQNTRREIANADLDAYMQRARQDYKLNRMSNLVNMFLQGGLFVMPTGTSMYRSWAAARPTTGAAAAAGQTSGLGGLFDNAAGVPQTDLFSNSPILGGLRNQ